MSNTILNEIETKYTQYLNNEVDSVELTIKEAKFILTNNEDFVDELVNEASKLILSKYDEMHNKLCLISEVCIDNSKQHITDRQSIEKIVEIL